MTKVAIDDGGLRGSEAVGGEVGLTPFLVEETGAVGRVGTGWSLLTKEEKEEGKRRGVSWLGRVMREKQGRGEGGTYTGVVSSYVVEGEFEESFEEPGSSGREVTEFGTRSVGGKVGERRMEKHVLLLELPSRLVRERPKLSLIPAKTTRTKSTRVVAIVVDGDEARRRKLTIQEDCPARTSTLPCRHPEGRGVRRWPWL